MIRMTFSLTLIKDEVKYVIHEHIDVVVLCLFPCFVFDEWGVIGMLAFSVHYL